MQVHSVPNRPIPVDRPVFPKDEGAHPGVKTEWWYLHGHLEDDDGRKYGFMQALFDVPDVIDARYNRDLPAMPGGTLLDSALTELDSGKHQHFRELHLRRPGTHSEGLQAGRLDEQLIGSHGRWQLQRITPSTVHVQAPLPEGRLVLHMEDAKPPLMMGGDGEIAMGPKGLSKYYTIPNFQVSGKIVMGDGTARQVKGTAWLDHQWGDMSMFEGFRGWDWFGVQLDGGTQLNLFNFRGEDGTSVQTEAGISRPDGSQEHAKDLRVEPVGEWWTSPRTGNRYPLEWHVVVPSRNIDLTVKAAMDNQEMVGTWPHDASKLSVIPTYWEGSSLVSGTVDGKPVQGKAYMELVGYEEQRGDADEAASIARERLATGQLAL